MSERLNIEQNRCTSRPSDERDTPSRVEVVEQFEKANENLANLISTSLVLVCLCSCADQQQLASFFLKTDSSPVVHTAAAAMAYDVSNLLFERESLLASRSSNVEHPSVMRNTVRGVTVNSVRRQRNKTNKRNARWSIKILIRDT